MPAFDKSVARQLAAAAVRPKVVAQAVRRMTMSGLLPRAAWQRLPRHDELTIAVPGGLRFEWAPGHDDATARELYWRGLRGPEGASLLPFAALAASSQLVIDIGANTGLWSLVALAAGTADVIAFEPVAESAAQIVRNLSANDWVDRCAVRQEAVGSTTGFTTFHVPDGPFPASASLNPSGFRGQPGTQKALPVVRLDDVLDRSPDLVKIDVEGFEDEVLKGMERLLREAQPKIVVECNPDGPYSEVDRVLTAHGYELYHLVRGGPVHREHIAPDQTETYRNYLALPAGTQPD
jgi:FkbM family methyltransferase